MDTLLRDVRFAARLLLRDRWFTAAAGVTLALGIAANNTVFTMVNGVLLREMPFDQPDRVVEFRNVSYLDLQNLRATLSTFEEVGAVDQSTMNMADEEHAAERFLGAYISSNGFRAIGVPPILGRDFRDEDERPGAPPVVILGQSVWQRRYRSDPDIVGRTVRVNGIPSTIVGVMPEGFGFPEAATLWQPLSLERAELLSDRRAAVLDGFGRLRVGVTIDQARADLNSVVARLEREYPDGNREVPVAMGTFRSGVSTDTQIRMALLLMMGAVGFVLLIACGNVANLILVRAAARAREMAVRVSIGATRWQIVRQLLVESTLLASIAGVLALALSAISIRLLWRVIVNVGGTPPYWLAFTIDGRVLTFFLAVCLGTSVLAGLAPASFISRTSVAHLVNESGRALAGSRRGHRWTATFVSGQLALTLVLLSGAGLMIRSLLLQVVADAGVDTSRLVTLRLDLPPSYATASQRETVYREIEDRLVAVPGLHASYASNVPLGGAALRRLVIETTSPDIDVTRRPLVGHMTIGTTYFETIGAPAVRGRTFQRTDNATAAVAIVNERLAAMYFPGQEPIGRRLRLVVPRGNVVPPNNRDEWLTIVGVAPNVRQRSTEGGVFDPIVYVPVSAGAVAGTNIIIRSGANPGGVAAIVRRQIRSVDADLPVFDIRMVDDQLSFLRWGQRVLGSMFAVFATIALVLGTIGLYAVTAYSTLQRTREIGIRVALGAQPRDVRWLVIRGAVMQLAVGLLLGTAGGLAVSRVLPAQLAGASGSDPATLTAVAALLVATGLVACLIPARRAACVDPAIALRAE